MTKIFKVYIKKTLKEDWKKNRDKYILDSGAETEMGSFSHLTELENLLKKLKKLRDAQNRSSATRFAYASAISKLKQQIKKINKKLEKDGLVWEK